MVDILFCFSVIYCRFYQDSSSRC